jgi:hypothetical protein
VELPPRESQGGDTIATLLTSYSGSFPLIGHDENGIYQRTTNTNRGR